jgi:hypothetical protein
MRRAYKKDFIHKRIEDWAGFKRKAPDPPVRESRTERPQERPPPSPEMYRTFSPSQLSLLQYLAYLMDWPMIWSRQGHGPQAPISSGYHGYPNLKLNTQLRPVVTTSIFELISKHSCTRRSESSYGRDEHLQCPLLSGSFNKTGVFSQPQTVLIMQI